MGSSLVSFPQSSLFLFALPVSYFRAASKCGTLQWSPRHVRNPPRPPTPDPSTAVKGSSKRQGGPRPPPSSKASAASCVLAANGRGPHKIAYSHQGNFQCVRPKGPGWMYLSWNPTLTPSPATDRSSRPPRRMTASSLPCLELRPPPPSLRSEYWTNTPIFAAPLFARVPLLRLPL